MQRKTIVSMLLSGLLGVATSSMADTPEKTQTYPEALTIINKVSHNQLTVLNNFPGPGNLEGFVLQPRDGGQPIIMYADKKGDYVVYGTVIDKDGVNLTEKDNQEYINKYTALKIADNLAETSSITQGSSTAPYKVMIVADPNCSACNFAYKAIKPFIDKGDLQVKWIFVYFVRPDSQAKAAAIMNAKDPAKAMEENENGFDMKTEEGGIAPLKDIPQTLLDKLEGNMKFMRDTGINSTPTLIYYNKSGQLEFARGLPSNMEQFLKDKAPRDKK